MRAIIDRKFKDPRDEAARRELTTATVCHIEAGGKVRVSRALTTLIGSGTRVWRGSNYWRTFFMLRLTLIQSRMGGIQRGGPMGKTRVRYVNLYAVRKAQRGMADGDPDGEVLLQLLWKHADRTSLLSPHVLDDVQKGAVERALNVRLVPVGT